MMNKNDMRYIAYLSDIHLSLSSVTEQVGKKSSLKVEEENEIMKEYLGMLKSNIAYFIQNEGQHRAATMSPVDSQDAALESMINHISSKEPITREELNQAYIRSQKKMSPGSGKVEFRLPKVEYYSNLYPDNYVSNTQYNQFAPAMQYAMPQVDEQGFRVEPSYFTPYQEPQYIEDVPYEDNTPSFLRPSDLFDVVDDGNDLVTHGSHPILDKFLR